MSEEIPLRHIFKSEALTKAERMRRALFERGLRARRPRGALEVAAFTPVKISRSKAQGDVWLWWLADNPKRDRVEMCGSRREVQRQVHLDRLKHDPDFAAQIERTRKHQQLVAEDRRARMACLR